MGALKNELEAIFVYLLGNMNVFKN